MIAHPPSKGGGSFTLGNVLREPKRRGVAGALTIDREAYVLTITSLADEHVVHRLEGHNDQDAIADARRFIIKSLDRLWPDAKVEIRVGGREVCQLMTVQDVIAS